MANRRWRVTGSFAKVAEVAVIVDSPNWQGAVRKGALAIKKADVLKGRRLSAGVFTVQLQEGAVPVPITGIQTTLPEANTTQVVNEPTNVESETVVGTDGNEEPRPPNE
jgi:hypothetical protein